MKSIALRVEVPIASFRQSRAREYLQTYPVPPPATVYGMLLSLVGEVDRYRHCGVRLAIALSSIPQKSTVIRTLHRFKRSYLYDPKNIRPDYQEILTDVNFVVWVEAGQDQSDSTLVDRLQQAFANPASIDRFSGLSLGESGDLVNQISLLSSTCNLPLHWLLRNGSGELTLPYWVDHVGARGTYWHRYLLQTIALEEPTEAAWTDIRAA